MSINIESSFSFNGSLIKKDSLFNLKELGYKALGIVDDNTIFFLTFYNEMKAQGIKPILGLRLRGKLYDLIIYAKNFDGYKEILKYASSIERNELIDPRQVIKSENIIYCFDVTYLDALNIGILKDDYDYFKTSKLSVTTGIDFAYYPAEVDLYPKLKKYFKVIILDKVKYIKEEDKKASEILESILLGKELEEANLFDMEKASSYHLKPYIDYLNEYKGYDDLITLTEKFIDSINIEISYDSCLPKYKTRNDTPSDIYLKALASKGLSKRLEGTSKNVKVYKERLKYELEVIHSMGFDDYFLVVYDYVLYAKKHGIFVGPGRGSAASSLVSYSLGIVDIDPIEYNLYFERFLNPARKTMPDIDVDFEDTRRDEVIEYVSQKYGPFHVSLISTFQTFLAKSAIRDVSKILNISDVKASMISKEIKDKDNTIKSLKESSLVQNYYSKDKEYRELLDISEKIEGLPRSIGTHAAGVIISDKDLREYSEVHIGLNDFYQTSYDSDSLKDIGLLKMDFLSLKNLSIIHDILNDIKEDEGIDINLSKIPLDDKKTFDLLRNQSLAGIFQLDQSQGMTSLLKKMNVNNFLDISLCIALYRPGPMDSIPKYLKRRNGEEEVDYYDDSIKDILKETLGIIIYQEQTMAIVNKYSGLSLSDADTLRRAMSKKDQALILTLKDKFFEGARNLNRNEETTKRLFSDIEKFAEYGFNKAHSVAYSLITYELAYLKANYPKEFMANLLKNSSGTKYIKEAQKMRIKVLSPDFRYSSYRYRVHSNAIYMPYTEIKGIGSSYAKEIEKISLSGINSFEEFVSKAKGILPRALIEELILTGAFDFFGYNKKTMIDSLDGLFEFDPSVVKGLNYKIKKQEEYDFDYLKNKELELLGFNSKYHPLKNYLGELKKLSDISLGVDGVTIISYLSDLRIIKTKKSDTMASFTLEDEFSSTKAVLFPQDYYKCAHFLENNAIYKVFGSYKENKGEPQFVVRSIERIH